MGLTCLAQAYLDNQALLWSQNLDNLENKLDEGFRAFSIHRSLTADESSMIHHALSYGVDPIVLIVELEQYDLPEELQPYVFKPASHNLSLGLPLIGDQRLFVFGSSQPLELKLLSPFEDATTSTVITLLEKSASTQEVFSIIAKTGRLPNLIASDIGSAARHLVDSINSTTWFQGIALHENERIDDIRWRGTTEMVTSGKFHTTHPRIGPVKEVIGSPLISCILTRPMLELSRFLELSV